ncbi:MAG: hypothetical protein HEEMFOPI_01488 [Holosporales bacterium]
MKFLSSCIFPSFVFLLAQCGFASGVSAPNPPPQAASNQPGNPNNAAPTPQPIPSGSQPIAGMPPSNNGVISYPVPQAQTSVPPAMSGPASAATMQPKQPEKKADPLVSPALEQELAAKGLAAQKLYAVIENNKIYLVGPKKKAAPLKKGKRK